MKRSGHIKDSQRWSWITPNFDYCFLCSATHVPLEKHEVFHGTANRQKSKDYGMVVSLCPRCHRLVHSDRNVDRRLQALVQAMWESKGHSREEWMNIFHKNYRED